MAEKGVLLKDQASGKSIAAVDAVALDGDLQPRVIQLMDITEGHIPSPFVAVRTNVLVEDGTDLDDIPYVMNNLITCGDKTNIAVFTTIPNRVAGHGCRVTLLLMDNEATPQCIGLLENIEQEADSDFYFFAANIGVAPVQTYQLLGAAKIGVHVCGYGMTFIPGVNVYAHVY